MLFPFILLTILLITYAALSGFKDAILYGRKGAESFAWNEHLVFTLERGCIAALIVTSAFLSPWVTMLMLLPFGLMFSFAHNQSYYWGRSRIDSTPYRWNYTSSTSTARLDLNYKVRLLLFVMGVALAVSIGVYAI